MAEPPRSTKKKSLRGDLPEGMSTKLLLISDWTNAQLVNYCSACGILFDASALHENECLEYIHKVEKNRSLSCLNAHLERAETSSEVLGH